MSDVWKEDTENLSSSRGIWQLWRKTMLQNVAALSSWWSSSPSTCVFCFILKRNLLFTWRHGIALQKTGNVHYHHCNSNLALRKFISRYLNHQQLILQKWLNGTSRTVCILITPRNVLSLHPPCGPAYGHCSTPPLTKLYIMRRPWSELRTGSIQLLTKYAENSLFQTIIWKQ